MQRAYRKLVRALSYPGLLVDLAPEASTVQIAEAAEAMIVVLARVLLDAEVRFALLPSQPELADLLAGLTYSRATTPGEADFLIARGPAALAEALAAARIGTLVDPHHGATILAEAAAVADSSFAAAGDTRRAYELAGPGIDGTRRLELALDSEWPALREEKNREFPMGVDVVFFDAAGGLVGLPRTTRVREVSWAT